jgi:hypothetical protein
MTRTVPFRLMILHLIHIFFTEALTFMTEISYSKTNSLIVKQK